MLQGRPTGQGTLGAETGATSTVPAPPVEPMPVAEWLSSRTLVAPRLDRMPSDSPLPTPGSAKAQQGTGARRQDSGVAHQGSRPVQGLAPKAGRPRRFAPGGGALLASWIVLTAIAAITLMIAALVVGMRLDDGQINGHLGTATATVLSVSPLQTGIEFVDAAGAAVRPPNGVLYPGLLSVGQRFMVEYSTLDPTVVRVGGRTAAVGDLVLGITVGATWVIGLLLVLWLRRRSLMMAGNPAGRRVFATRAPR